MCKRKEQKRKWDKENETLKTSFNIILSHCGLPNALECEKIFLKERYYFKSDKHGTSDLRFQENKIKKSEWTKREETLKTS